MSSKANRYHTNTGKVINIASKSSCYIDNLSRYIPSTKFLYSFARPIANSYGILRAMNTKLYLETTIISYLVSRPSRDLVTAAHQQLTLAWWEDQRRHFDLFISQFVLQEAGCGDAEAIQRRFSVVEGLPLLHLSDEVPILANALIEGRAIPVQARGDAFHIAIAAVHGMDFLRPGI